MEYPGTIAVSVNGSPRPVQLALEGRRECEGVCIGLVFSTRGANIPDGLRRVIDRRPGCDGTPDPDFIGLGPGA